MAGKLKILRSQAEKRGDHVGHLLPASWIELNGKFTVVELETIIKAVRDNYLKISNGHTK